MALSPLDHPVGYHHYLCCGFGVVIGSNYLNIPILFNPWLRDYRNPPATLVARASGKIQALFVQDKQKVIKMIMLQYWKCHRLPASFQSYRKIEIAPIFFSSYESNPPKISIKAWISVNYNRLYFFYIVIWITSYSYNSITTRKKSIP